MFTLVVASELLLWWFFNVHQGNKELLTPIENKALLTDITIESVETTSMLKEGTSVLCKKNTIWDMKNKVNECKSS